MVSWRYPSLDLSRVTSLPAALACLACVTTSGSYLNLLCACGKRQSTWIPSSLGKTTMIGQIGSDDEHPKPVIHLDKTATLDQGFGLSPDKAINVACLFHHDVLLFARL